MSARFNHQVVEVPYRLFGGKFTDRIQEELDRMTAQGWELVSTLSTQNDLVVRLFFKKPN